MTTFIVSYDLIKQKNYQPLWDELNRLGGHRSLESFWLLNVNVNAQQLHDHLRQFMDGDDLLWVSELVANYAFTAKPGTKNWLANNPPAR